MGATLDPPVNLDPLPLLIGASGATAAFPGPSRHAAGGQRHAAPGSEILCEPLVRLDQLLEVASGSVVGEVIAPDRHQARSIATLERS